MQVEDPTDVPLDWIKQVYHSYMKDYSYLIIEAESSARKYAFGPVQMTPQEATVALKKCRAKEERSWEFKPTYCNKDGEEVWDHNVRLARVIRLQPACEAFLIVTFTPPKLERHSRGYFCSICRRPPHP